MQRALQFRTTSRRRDAADGRSGEPPSADRFHGRIGAEALALLVALLAALLLPPGVAAAAEVAFDVAPRVTTIGRPVRLRIEVSGAAQHDRPELPAIPGATVESAMPRSMTSMSIVNGRTTRTQSVTYEFSITPTAAGTLTIPEVAFVADGRRHAYGPVDVVVIPPRSDDRLRVEVFAEPEEVFVGQGVKLLLRVWVKRHVDARLSLRIPAAAMWQLLDADCKWGIFEPVVRPYLLHRQAPRSTVRTLASSGEEYDVFEFERRIWPLRPGPLDVGEIQVRIDYPTRLEQSRDFFDPGLRVAASDPLVAAPPPVTATVLALPEDGRPEAFRGAVGRFEIRSEVRPVDVAVGEPMTLAVTIVDRTVGGADLSTLAPPPLSAQEDLVADFRVASDPLAGDVQGWMKTFTTTIRPLRDDIVEVPPIEFAFFDPVERAYRAIRSAGLPIAVAPGAPFAFDEHSLADAMRGDRSRTTPAPATKPILNELDLDRLLAVRSARPGAGFVAAIALPPALFTAFALWWARRSADERDPARVRRRRARSSALSALTPGATPSAIRGALVDYLADLSGMPPGAMTSDEAEECARSLGCAAEGMAALRSLLHRCDAAAFAGARDEASEALRAEARAWVESQRPAGQPSPRRAAAPAEARERTFEIHGGRGDRERPEREPTR
ncbi:MAG TPA: BatD family protein [Phycisphaerales bacterium]|nr:BatD family protein [Phycisphaerales bacterium]HMP38084.1 BatD family protein [Phycisphaerales bacterium]